MKLILCPDCGDVVALRVSVWRTCYCGKSEGGYKKDGLNATIAGAAIPLGFSNPSLVDAILNQPDEGWGRKFDAFVIPKKCETVEVRKDA